MLKKLKIADIKIGKRHRKDMGDLTSLADSIRRLELLQPIGVTDKFRLVFGERRLRAQRDILKKKTIIAHIVNVNSIVSGEYAENEIRKDFTPSERVAIAQAIEQQVGNRQGQRTDRKHVGQIPQVEPGRAGRPVKSLLRRQVLATIRLTAKPPKSSRTARPNSCRRWMTDG